MKLRERAWARALGVALPVAARLSRRPRAELAERGEAGAAAEEWAAARRDLARPLLWLHAASAGEMAGAEPVVAELRARDETQLAVTYTSPSAVPAAAALSPDWAAFLPPDVPAACGRVLDALLPEALVFAKWDVWPVLTAEAARRGVGLGLVNGTVADDSSRLRVPARWLLGPAYQRLGAVGAASEDDAERLRRLGVRPERLRVTGDAAFDRALARAARPGPAARALRELPGFAAPVDLRLVAGSTWADDEAELLGAASRLEAEGLRVALAIVPHEPTAAAVARLEEACRAHLGRPPLLWSRAVGGAEEPPAGKSEEPPAGVPVVVDRVGLLADLYGAADVAWVGGGFGPGGVHSVVEPAAAGVPVLFGDRRTRREARALVGRGGGAAVREGGLAGVLRRLAARAGARREMGRRARAYVASEAGAAARGAELLSALLGRGTAF